MPWLIYSTTYTYNWVDKVTVRVQCIVFLAQEHGTWPWPVPQILIMKNTGLNKELKFKHFQQSHQLSHCRQASSVINMAASQPCQWACLVSQGDLCLAFTCIVMETFHSECGMFSMWTWSDYAILLSWALGSFSLLITSWTKLSIQKNMEKSHPEGLPTFIFIFYLEI